MIYIRLAVYAVAGLVAAAGFGTFDAEAGTLTLNLNEIVMALAAGGAISGAVFAKWGKR